MNSEVKRLILARISGIRAVILSAECCLEFLCMAFDLEIGRTNHRLMSRKCEGVVGMRQVREGPSNGAEVSPFGMDIGIFCIG